MKRISGFIALAGMLALGLTQAHAQTFTYIPSPTNITATPGSAFQVTALITNANLLNYDLVDANPFTLGVVAIPLQPFGTYNPNSSFAPAVPAAGTAFTWWIDPTTQDFSSMAKNSSRTYKFDFLLGGPADIPEGGYRFNITANDTSNLQLNGAFTLVVATPEFGSVFSLGGLLFAGGAGLYVRRRRTAKSPADTK